MHDSGSQHTHANTVAEVGTWQCHACGFTHNPADHLQCGQCLVYRYANGQPESPATRLVQRNSEQRGAHAAQHGEQLQPTEPYADEGLEGAGRGASEGRGSPRGSPLQVCRLLKTAVCSVVAVGGTLAGAVSGANMAQVASSQPNFGGVARGTGLGTVPMAASRC